MTKKLQSVVNLPFVVCLAALLFNDFYLKTAYHNWFTGKLSDFCGLFVFVAFWSALFPLRKHIVCFFTALLFVIWKSPLSQGFINFFSEHFYTIDRVIDVTDLMALIVLPIPLYQNSRQWKVDPLPLGLLTVFSFCATSIPKPTLVLQQPQYLLFKPNAPFNTSDWPSTYVVHHLDSVVIIDIKMVSLSTRPYLDDEFHKVQILKDIDLRLLSEVKNDDDSLHEYYALRDSLTIKGQTSITLDLDSVTDHINFKNNRMDGSFKRFSSKNALKVDGTYKNGIEDSVWTFYNDQGEVILRKHFQEGQLIKQEFYEQSKIKSQHAFNTREETVRNKYFHIALIFVVMAAIATKVYLNFKRSITVISLNSITVAVGVLILPLATLLLAKAFSSIIPNAYSTFFLGIFGEVILIYLIMAPVYLAVFSFLKLRSRYDLLYYILLFSLAIVVIEEFIQLKNLVY
jgi:hypothetical protein